MRLYFGCFGAKKCFVAAKEMQKHLVPPSFDDIDVFLLSNKRGRCLISLSIATLHVSAFVWAVFVHVTHP